MDERETLYEYLRVRRDNFRGKPDGLSDVDVRRPFTPTRTNLPGLAKHVASIDFGYVGKMFGCPSGRRRWLAHLRTLRSRPCLS